MSRIKTCVCLALAFLISAPVSVRAGNDLSRDFAACTGLLRAQLEFQWLMNDPAAERTEVRGHAMASLLDTMMLPENSAQLLAVRIEAKHAHAALLHRSVFNDDPIDAAWAQRRAEERLSQCSGMLLI